jgi:hypothetical protein
MILGQVVLAAGNPENTQEPFFSKREEKSKLFNPSCQDTEDLRPGIKLIKNFFVRNL